MTNCRFQTGCELTYQVTSPCAFIFNVSVVDNQYQKIAGELFATDPQVPVEESRAPLEDKRHHRLVAQPGWLVVNYSATVDLSHHVEAPDSVPQTPPGEAPSDVVPYLYPSRYCESDKLARLAHHEFGKLQPGFSRVTAVCNWIRDNVEYLGGATNPMTSAFDTATERAGVCRDFAHLGIAFCRALAIPARFVSGYALGLVPPDFHAYFEAYLNGRWYIFDATRLSPQPSFIRIGTGRDAADTSFATIFGAMTMTSMKVTMELVSGDAPQFSTDAISTC